MPRAGRAQSASRSRVLTAAAETSPRVTGFFRGPHHLADKRFVADPPRPRRQIIVTASSWPLGSIWATAPEGLI